MLVIKLIKQTADFKNTIYMVAMDMDHVAHSIAQFYECNEQHSFGANYLQKIIQQPIRVPKFQKIHLSKYIEQKLFTEFITKIVETAEPSLQILLKNEVAESKSKVLELTLPLIDTPRQVIQWVNNLKFTLPNLFLTHEVNLTDFLLLSFLKVSFPDIYEKIRSEKQLLLAPSRNETKKNETKTFIENLVKLKQLQSDGKQTILKMLLEYLLDSNYGSNKRLCTEEYYDKYFVYDTPEGVISEAEMQSFLTSLKEEKTTGKEILGLIEELIAKYHIRLVVSKFNEIKYYYQNQKIGEKRIIKFLIALSQTQNSHEVKDYSDYLQRSLENFLSFTYDMINLLYPKELQNNAEEVSKPDEFMTELAQKSAFMFLTVLLSRGLYEGIDFQKEVYRAMVPAWIKRYKAERHKGDIKSIFEFDSTCSSDLLKVWKNYDEKDFETYVNDNLYTNFENAKRFPYTHFKLSKIKENSRQPEYAIAHNFDVFFKDLLDLDRLSNFLKESLKNNKSAVTEEEKERINDFIKPANQYLKRKSS
jgi:hypothetical protein